MEPLVSVSGLSHTYGVKENCAVALRRVDLEVAPGERLAIMGRSGSGKTTLLNILAGLETPTGGRVVIAGRDLAAAGRRDREAYRRNVAGYVWQQPEDGLLPGLTAVENVMVPVLAGRGSGPEQVAVALGLLDAMGLRERLHDRPALLSPLEMQRLAVAVALANRPLLLLADELTARLDWDVACELLGDLTSLLDRLGTAAILVTHDPRVARYVDTALMIRDGVAAAATPEPGLARGHSR